MLRRHLVPGLIFTILVTVIIIIFYGIYEGILSKKWEACAIAICVVAIGISWYFFFRDSLPRIFKVIKKFLGL